MNSSSQTCMYRKVLSHIILGVLVQTSYLYKLVLVMLISSLYISPKVGPVKTKLKLFQTLMWIHINQKPYRNYNF